MPPSVIPFFEQVNLHFDKAARLTRYPTGLLEQIKACNSVIHMTFPIKRDDGSIEVIHAWRPSTARTSSPSRAASATLRTSVKMRCSRSPP